MLGVQISLILNKPRRHKGHKGRKEEEDKGEAKKLKLIHQG